jgi:hypothetical protein
MQASWETVPRTMKQGRYNSKWSEIKAKFTWRSEHKSRKWRMKRNRSPKSARLLAKWALAREREREREARNPLCLWSSPFLLPASCCGEPVHPGNPRATNHLTRHHFVGLLFLPFSQLGKLNFFYFYLFSPLISLKIIFLWRIFAILLKIFWKKKFLSQIPLIKIYFFLNPFFKKLPKFLAIAHNMKGYLIFFHFPIFFNIVKFG